MVNRSWRSFIMLSSSCMYICSLVYPHSLHSLNLSVALYFFRRYTDRYRYYARFIPPVYHFLVCWFPTMDISWGVGWCLFLYADDPCPGPRTGTYTKGIMRMCLIGCN